MHYKLDKDTFFLISQKAIIKYKGKYLILKSTDDNKWEMPGGLIDDNESLTAALKREVKEETGLVAKIGEPIMTTIFWHHRKFTLNNKAWNSRVVVIGYNCTVNSDKIRLSHEHSEYAWVNVKEIKKYSFSANSKFIKDYLTK